MRGEKRENGFWVASGGEGAELVVLLHGIATNADVFRHLAPRIAARGCRWIAPDFRGHGRSTMVGPFGFGNHAADVAQLLAAEDMTKVTILGHSFGGVIAALLCTGLFGPLPARMIAYGTKLDWTPAEIEGAHLVASRPRKIFATRDEAAERYLKLSGLAGLVGADAPEVEAGITARDGGFALAADPGVFRAVGPSIDAIFAQVATPLRLALGENDRITTFEALCRHDPQTVLIPGVGHNIQTEAPDQIIALMA